MKLMRSLVLHSSRSWWRWGVKPSALLRLILLLGLRARAQSICLARDGDHVKLWCCYPDRLEHLIPPPPYLADELVEEVRRLACWRDRIADWWDRRRGRKVLTEREGTARLLLGGPSADFLHYWVLPYSGGVLVELTPITPRGAAERVEEILIAQQDIFKGRPPKSGVRPQVVLCPLALGTRGRRCFC
jgi:hypothetical protein